LITLASMPAGATEPDALQDSTTSLGARLTQTYIAPAMRNFHEAAADTHGALQGACAASDDSQKAQVADAFQNLVAAWSGIEFLRFGPLVENNRFERISFWPDPRGITIRQAQVLLAKEPADIPDAQALSTHSVALQGLPALEYVLYRDKGLLSGEPAANRSTSCAYAIAIAGNLKQLGGELAQAWKADGDYGQLFSTPSADNPLYRNPQEVASEVVKALSTGLQFQVDVKLSPALGADVAQAKATRSPFWRSGLTAHSVQHAARSMLDFYRAGGYRFSGAEWIDQNIQGELHGAITHLAALPNDTDKLFGNEDSHRELLLVTLMLGNAKDLVDQDMAPALGVRIGFNALDGD